MLLNKRRTPFGPETEIYEESSLSGEIFFAEGHRSSMPARSAGRQNRLGPPDADVSAV
jgi:hypothetical protein